MVCYLSTHSKVYKITSKQKTFFIVIMTSINTLSLLAKRNNLPNLLFSILGFILYVAHNFYIE